MAQEFILPVRERAERAIQNRLQQITRDNGYAITVRHVRRLREIVERDDDPPAIHMVPFPTTTDAFSAGPGDLISRVPLTVIYYHRGEDYPAAMICNLFAADIIRALLGEPVVDDSSVPFGGHEYPVTISFSFSEVSSFWFGMLGDSTGQLGFEYKYTTCATDPRLWGTDDAFVTVTE